MGRSKLWEPSILELFGLDRYEPLNRVSGFQVLGLKQGIQFNSLNNYYNKILKSDKLSTVLILALIGQCNRTVRVMPK